MTQADWDAASSAALALFAHGQAEAAQRGLLLVDTKYELGKDADGNILLLDEVRPSAMRLCNTVCCVTSGSHAAIFNILLLNDVRLQS
jgi:phosphoribosylaminoimidazole-succinocarboxamide synthase